MKKQQNTQLRWQSGMKRTCSYLLALAMAGSSLAALAPRAVAAQSKDGLAIVSAKEAAGNINLSSLGKTDWIHFSTDEDGAPMLNRRANLTSSPTDIASTSTYGNAQGTESESWFGTLEGAGGRFAQFVADTSGELKNLKVSLCRASNEALTMTAELYAIEDGQRTLVAKTEVSSDDIQPFAYNPVTIRFSDPVYLSAGTTYALCLYDASNVTDGKTLLWEISKMGREMANTFTYGKVLSNGALEYQSTENGYTHVFSFDIEYLSTNEDRIMSTYANAGALEENSWVYGQNSAKGSRFVQFRATNSGELKDLTVCVGCLNQNQVVTATFYEVTADGPVEIAKTTFPTTDVSFGAYSDVVLDFAESIMLKQDSLYALTLTPDNETLDGKQLYWRPSISFDAEQYTYGWLRGDEWIYENSKGGTHVFSLKIKTEASGDAQGVGLIQGAPVGEVEMGTTGSTPVSYTWYDGIPTAVGMEIATTGTVAYQDGEYTGVISEDTGYKFTIPASNAMQRLTLTAGAQDASAQVVVQADGKTIYESDVLTADATAKTNQYTINAEGGKELEVFVKMTEKSSADGKLLLGAVALSQIAPEANVDYLAKLTYEIPVAEAYVGLMNSKEAEALGAILPAALDVLANNSENANAVFAAYYCLHEALNNLKTAMGQSNRYAFNTTPHLTGSFGWEGDKDAPIAWIDGSYELRDTSVTVTFGVTDLEPGSVAWYNKDNYLPCFVSEYTKDGVSYVIENFADLLVIDGNRFEIAYSRMSATNNTDKTQVLPEVSVELIPLNEAAEKASVVKPGETVVRDYCIGADRFGGRYPYPEASVLQASGSWDEHYDHMKEYWEGRLANIVNIEEIPEDYQELVYAYKAGYIYTLIIADDYELHVGENGYDQVFDHDVIGILVTLVELGHTENFREYCETILQNIQYPDAAWKFSWPFAVYLQKTGDFDTISYYWNDMADGKAGIVTNTHKIASERESYPLSEGEVIDLIEGASYDQGKARDLGTTGATNTRYQTFIPSVSAPLDEGIVTVHAIGEPSPLVAKLYEGTGADAKELASCTIPLETFLAFNQVPKNNGTLSEARYVFLDFDETVELQADTLYTIALTQETPSDTDYYKWCKVYEMPKEYVSGTIGEDGIWETKDEPCTFKLSLAAETARIMKKTVAIDSYGYWTIDNYSALMGLTSYAYLCEAMYEKYGDESYKAEYDWAKAEYDSLMKDVDAVLKNTMAKYDINYIPISMIMPTEMTARANLMDANWASMYEFGRWDWDGYLFGCDQNNIMHGLLDATYDHIIESKKGYLPSKYTMGGYPGVSSAYNAGYFEAALAGEEFRTYGIEAYLWLINNCMSCPYGTWEGISGATSNSLWNRTCSGGGGGSSQHMWGQSMNTKVLLDSFLAEKADGTVIIGRGLPVSFNADGETVTISNWLADNGKRIGFTMTTTGKEVTVTLTGDDLAYTASLELPALVGNIASVSGDLSFDNATGTILLPAGTKSVTITMQNRIVPESETLQILDGITGEKLGALTAEDLENQDMTKLAEKLGCLTRNVVGTEYVFAGWFTEPQVSAFSDYYALPSVMTGFDAWATKSIKDVKLEANGSAIYANYIKADYLNTTIAYTSNASRATKVFAISTAPADLFANYGFVLSTAPSASDENLVIGGKIDGLNVAKLEKTTIYSWISVAPFSAAAPKTANDFNGGLGGVYKDGTDGYISYGMVTNMPIGKTISARAYYTTLDGTIVYGSTVQQLLEANSNVTGLE